MTTSLTPCAIDGRTWLATAFLAAGLVVAGVGAGVALVRPRIPSVATTTPEGACVVVTLAPGECVTLRGGTLPLDGGPP